MCIWMVEKLHNYNESEGEKSRCAECDQINNRNRNNENLS